MPRLNGRGEKKIGEGEKKESVGQFEYLQMVVVVDVISRHIVRIISRTFPFLVINLNFKGDDKKYDAII